MGDNQKMEIKSNWLRLVVYFGFWIICSIAFYVPIFLFFPTSLNGSKADYTFLLENDLLFLAANQVASVCGILLATYLMVNQIEKKKINDIKLTLNFTQFFNGLLIGLLVILIFALVVQLLGIVRFSYQTVSAKIIFSVFLYTLVAIGEEIIVRGYILNNLCEKMNNYLAVFVSSIIFGAMHLFNDDFTMIGFFNISLSGFLMGVLLIKSNTISAPIGLHWAWNFIQGPIAGFNVSGHKEVGIFHGEPMASNLLTGGNFGAEGSVLLIPIVLITVYTVSKYYRPVTSQVTHQEL